jgi:hypothetical protein
VSTIHRFAYDFIGGALQQLRFLRSRQADALRIDDQHPIAKVCFVTKVIILEWTVIVERKLIRLDEVEFISAERGASALRALFTMQARLVDHHSPKFFNHCSALS